MRKKLVILAALLLSGTGLGWYFRARSAMASATEYKLVRVTRGDLRQMVTVTGTLEPRIKITLTSPKIGQVEELSVNEGEYVKKGQRLAVISSEDRINLLDAARGNLELARRSGDASEVEKAEKELAIAEKAYQQVTLTAPIAGLVTLRNVEPGQKVTANTTILEISDKLVVRILIDETDISKVREGMRAKVTLDAYPEETLYGKIIKIAYTATTESNVAAYEALVELTSPTTRLLKSGMTADLEIVIKEKKGVLKIPRNAVKAGGGRSFVLIPQGGQRPPERWAVTVGEKDDDGVEVVSGLEEGDDVAIAVAKNAKKTDTARKDKEMGPGMGGMDMGGGPPMGGGGPMGGRGGGAGGGGGRR
ncbi:MAG TPA: efflux RND transporter periplasmic adaptor subunit [Elusimicrobiales bacterium]|nr:efflux RND transporter periplasmic adaptor subunit [Elusimicrobiales bacterium]